ncbi:SDR family oxidoreductase [Akkermansiaceae bacterium]|nr:SDR family oxidoreductase [Akkermansiaceae bacterium]
MKVLVTGPSGFVGRKVCKRLLADEIDVRGAWRKTSPLADGYESVVVGNIDGSTDWSNALKGIDAVVHLAARVHIMDDTAADPVAAFREVNVDGTGRLAEEAAKSGVKRFVFISSIKVNGEVTLQSSDRRSEGGSQTSEVSGERRRAKNQEVSPENSSAGFSESDQPCPQDPYGQSKYEAEVTLRKIEASTGMEVVILRPPLLYGPGVKANLLKLIHWVDKGIPLPLGGIQNKRSLLSLTNFADVISKCLIDPRAGGRTFTVCDGDDISSAELVERVAKALGKAPRLITVPEWLMKCAGKLTGNSEQVQRLCSSLQVDSSHVRERLDWKPPVTMDEELGKVARWYRSL